MSKYQRNTNYRNNITVLTQQIDKNYKSFIISRFSDSMGKWELSYISNNSLDWFSILDNLC